MGKNNHYNKNNQKKDYSKFYITIIICLIIYFWAGMSFHDSRYMSLKSMYDWETGRNFELQQNFNLSLELAKEQGKRESLSFTYNHVVEETSKQSEWIDDVSSDYFAMRQANQDIEFQLLLCRYGVPTWEEYVEKKFGEGYVENNP